MDSTHPWKCEVCGYVHRGTAPPDYCPICGADADRFSPLKVMTPPAATTHSGPWRCSICDHLHQGETPPPCCPVCGAAGGMFVPHAPPPAEVTAETAGRLLILGAGIAGVTAAEYARSAAPGMGITLLTREDELPYYRLNLTRLLAKEVAEDDLHLKPAEWYAQQRIEILRGEALAIDREARLVQLQDGRRLPYDRLILACGAHPFVPPLAGGTRVGVMTLRTLADVRRLLAQLHPATRCVCIGGGLLGLETAAALQRRGATVTVLEGFGWLLPRQLPAQAGAMLQRSVERLGIAVHCGARVEELGGDELVRSVRLADGRELPTDLVIVTAGVRPNSFLARQAGLAVAGGVVVDGRMTTSDARILAAGDVAEHAGVLFGIWPAAYAQGMVAGSIAAGVDISFPGLPPSNRLKVLGVELFSIGKIAADDASYRLCEWSEGESYRGILCRDNRVVGGAMLGDTALAPQLKEMVENGAQIDERPELKTLFPELGAA